MNISVGLAFLAGMASFLSPCVFSLVPAYIGYLSGRSIASTEGSIEGDKRITAFLHGLMFVLGFSVVFVTLGLAASAIGALLSDLSFYLAKIGGLVVVIFGLHMTGILRIKFLEYDLRPQSIQQQRQGYLSSFLMGIFFSAGWSPCVGPVLGAILTFAMNGGDLSKGAVLLTSYSLGLGIPFLIAALGIGWVTKVLQRHSKIMHYAEIVMGVILIIVGVMLFFGIFETLSRYGWWVDFGI